MKDLEDYRFHTIFTSLLKLLNKYLLNIYYFKVLYSLYSKYTKKELIEDEDLIIIYFSDRKARKEYLDNLDDNKWKDILD